MKSVILVTVKFRNLPTVRILARNLYSLSLFKTRLIPDKIRKQGQKNLKPLGGLGKRPGGKSEEVKYFNK